MKRKPTKQEEEQLLKTIKSNFLIGLKTLLAYPMYKGIDFTQTLKHAVKDGEISINKSGVIISLGSGHEVPEIPTGVHDDDVVNNPWSRNEIMKKSQLKPLVKEVLREIYRKRLNESASSSTYDDYNIEFDSLVIPGISTENDAVEITVSIDYDADTGHEARGLFGAPEHSEEGEGASVELTGDTITSVRVQGKEIDLKSLQPDQITVLNSVVKQHINDNEENITNKILDSLGY